MLRNGDHPSLLLPCIEVCDTLRPFVGFGVFKDSLHRKGIPSGLLRRPGDVLMRILDRGWAGWKSTIALSSDSVKVPGAGTAVRARE